MSGVPSKILVIDDEPQTRRFLRASLSLQNCEVLEADTGEKGLRLCTLEQPEMIVLDVNLPDMHGLEVLRRLREWSNMPVIVLSVEDNDRTIIEALDSGADDYVTKPFKMAVFMARLRANFRAVQNSNNGTGAPDPVLQSGDLRIDLAQRRCWVGKREVDLTPKEFELLALLTRHAGKVLTHKFMLEQVWGPAHVDDVEYARVFIKQIREKIEDDPANPCRIVTETGVGYRLTEPDEELA